jgi:serine/threonine protein kinase
MQEARIIASLNSPHVIPLLGVTRFSSLLPATSIVLPFAEHGDLHSCVHVVSRKPIRITCSLPTEVRIAGAISIINAIHYLHSVAELLHWDLKPENILLFENYTFKLCDFDHSRPLTTAGVTWSFSTVGWHAPEQSPPITTPYAPVPAEIFSLGLLLFTILVETPFTELASVVSPEIEFDNVALLKPSRIRNNTIIPESCQLHPDIRRFFNYVCNPSPHLRPASALYVQKMIPSIIPLLNNPHDIPV